MALKRTVLLFGTFDFLHIGHFHAFKQAKKYGKKLVIVLAKDHNVHKLKGAKPIHTIKERMLLLQHVDLVDEVLAGDTTLGTYDVLKRVNPDVIAIGYDQGELYNDLKKFVLQKKLDIQIVRLRSYAKKGRKSTIFRALFRV